MSLWVPRRGWSVCVCVCVCLLALDELLAAGCWS
jgi:hypothetical protein